MRILLTLFILLWSYNVFAASYSVNEFPVTSGADRLCGWDDSATSEVCFTLGTGLSTSGTTLNVTGFLDGSGTSNQIAYFSDSDTLASLTTATYPSLTELSYVKGVSSAIQTQFTGKASTALGNLASVAINTSLLPATDDGAALGSTSKEWSDLFLAEGGVINWDNSDATISQSSNTVTLAGAAFSVPDDAYGSSWDGSTEVATKNALYDKIETLTSSGSGTPGGADTYVQFNDGGSFGGEITFSYDKTINELFVANANFDNLVVNTSTTLNNGLTTENVDVGYAGIRIADISETRQLFLSWEETAAASKQLNFKVNAGNRTIDLAGNLTIAANFITSGANSLTLTTTGATNVTLPTSGTLYGTASGSISSSNLATSLSDEVGTDKLVFNTSPGFATAANPITSDAAALGTTALQWSDLFLAEGGVINFDNGDATITQVNDVVTVAGADLKVTTPGTASTSVATIDGTQELDNKTIDSAVAKGTWTASSWTTPAFTAGGDITQAENAALVLDAALSADGKYSGIVEAGTAGATLAFGDIVYLAAADSRWELIDADAESTAGNVKIGAVVLAAAADGNATNILLCGKIRADAAFPTFTVSAPVYLSTTAGDVQTSKPSGTDDVVRVVGAGNTSDELYFCPSWDYYTVQ